MKLITHNLLICNKKGCTTNNYPLRIQANKVEIYQEEAQMEYSKPLMQKIAQKLDLVALNQTLNEDLKWTDVGPLFPVQD